MAEIDNIVQITISRESTAVATASFNIPLVLASFTNFSERARVYTDIDAVGEDFNATDKAYIIAQKLFGQSAVGAVPPSIVIGRRQVDSAVLTPVVADATTYTVTVNGSPYSFTSGSGATATTIVTGLKAAIGTPTGVTVGGTSTLTVAPTTPGSAWSVSASTNVNQVNGASTEAMADALDAVSQVNSVWYAVVSDSHIQAEVVALSDAVASRRKIFGTSSQDAAVITTGTTDVAAVLDAKSASRTYGVYLPTADTEYPEAAWMGAQLPYTPGSNDWDFKRVSGVTVSGLSDTARANLRSKNMNMYTTVGGVNVMQDGNMFDGTPIDLQKVA